MGYYLVYSLLYLLSLLPLKVLFVFSPVLRFIIFRIFNYRTGLIRSNLKKSFPEKFDYEIENIRKNFEKYFCDLILETIKVISMPTSELSRRVEFENRDLIYDAYESKRNLVVVLGHHGNWEWLGLAFSLWCPHQVAVIYRPLRSNIFDRILGRLRARTGTVLYTMKTALKGMLSDRGKPMATGFIADQTPNPRYAYWLKFLNQDTPVFWGAEKIARKLQYQVVFCKVRRPKRGLYTLSFEDVCTYPAQSEDREITELHTKCLESSIRSQPEIWLWTHRRWKHSKPQSQ